MRAVSFTALLEQQQQSTYYVETAGSPEVLLLLRSLPLAASNSLLVALNNSTYLRKTRNRTLQKSAGEGTFTLLDDEDKPELPEISLRIPPRGVCIRTSQKKATTNPKMSKFELTQIKGSLTTYLSVDWFRNRSNEHPGITQQHTPDQ